MGTTTFSTKAIEEEAHAAALHILRLARKGKDGVDVAAKAEFLEAKGIKVQVLDGPAMPMEAEHVWAWFGALHTGRSGGFGPGPLSWSDIHGFFNLYGIEARPWELSVLRVFDAAWIQVQSEGEKQ